MAKKKGIEISRTNLGIALLIGLILQRFIPGLGIVGTLLILLTALYLLFM